MKWIAAIAAVLVFSDSAQAHRLDEYLQATRIGLGMRQIAISIDLTPGVEVVEEVLSSIDPGGSAHIPPRQAEQYVERVLQDVRLDLDGQRQSLMLITASFPSRADMELGEGTIHLHAVATISTLKKRHHEILFRNDHLPKISVYLVNGLVPEDKAIRITSQKRDELQTEYRLDFVVGPASGQKRSP